MDGKPSNHFGSPSFTCTNTVRGDQGPHISYAKDKEKEWWRRTGSNRRPEACKATALPTELRPPIFLTHYYAFMGLGLVGLGRLELPTSRLSSARSNQLSYRPLNPYVSPATIHQDRNKAQSPGPVNPVFILGRDA